MSHEQAYLFVAEQPCIQKPVVLKRKTQKGEGRAAFKRALKMLTTCQMRGCDNENEEKVLWSNLRTLPPKTTMNMCSRGEQMNMKVSASTGRNGCMF